MKYLPFFIVFLFISFAALMCIENGDYVLGTIGFIFSSMMSFTFGCEMNKGTDSPIFYKEKE